MPALAYRHFGHDQLALDGKAPVGLAADAARAVRYFFPSVTRRFRGDSLLEATPRRLEKAREEGQVARTQELGAWSALYYAINYYLQVEEQADRLERHGVGQAGPPTSGGSQLGELGIIPGSMGARSYIVRGRGSAESWRLPICT